MPKINLHDLEGKNIGDLELKEEIFNIPLNKEVIFSSLIRQLNNKRQGSASTKTKAQVRGGGRKPWKQKGTGRARHGSIRSPIWKGGGVVFGPHTKDYYYDLPKKIKNLALKSLLSYKFKNNSLIILDYLKLDTPKTKNFLEILKKLELQNKSTLIILKTKDQIVKKSAENIPKVKIINLENLNIFDILKSEYLIFTKESLNSIEEVLL
ncbi:MAG: 50S ribosomal protein L4 [Armatimonadetes bacterium]|nr:50S ribosomal protein L4 [Armatimonadota bacterium]